MITYKIHSNSGSNPSALISYKNQPSEQRLLKIIKSNLHLKINRRITLKGTSKRGTITKLLPFSEVEWSKNSPKYLQITWENNTVSSHSPKELR